MIGLELKLRPKNKFIPWGPHHAYIGLFMVLLAFLMVPYDYYSGSRELVFIVGMYLILDDFVEHTVTADTPGRLFFEKVLVPIIDFLNIK